MQRRTNRGAAHIAPPPKQTSNELKSADSSKLSQRFLGLPTRIYLILGLFLGLVFLTHLFSSSSNSIPKRHFSNANLKPINYLNTSSVDNPFPFCPNYGPGDEIGLKYGAQTLEQSRLHLGSAARVRRVLRRAMAGMPVTISVIGASVSACHGVGDDPVSPQCYPSLFFQWWNSIFPHSASELTNGAMRRANSAYFGFCSAHHIPDVTDLVIVELDAADIPNEESRDHFELLIRSLLLRPGAPAVLLLGHFAPQIYKTYGFSGSDHWHNAVAQFYDVPHISTKSALYSTFMASPDAMKPYFVDPILASPQGHVLLADILAAYFQSQICATWAALPVPTLKSSSNGGASGALFGGVGMRKGVPPEEGRDVGDDKIGAAAAAPVAPAMATADPRAGVPSALISTRPGTRAFVEIAPFCAAANDLINPLPPSLFYGSGWISVHPEGGAPPGTESLTAHYWSCSLPTSKLRVPIKVGAGQIGVYYIREPISSIGEGSAVECWVDDNYGGAVVIENAAEIGELETKLQVIDNYVATGSHYVECQLMGEEGVDVPAFKIVGVFAT